MEISNNNDQKKEERQQVIELGSDITKSERGNIYTLTIIDQVEGHQVLPETVTVELFDEVTIPVAVFLYIKTVFIISE